MMAPTPTDAIEAADDCLRRQQSFFLCRLPGEDSPTFHPYHRDFGFRGAVVRPFRDHTAQPADIHAIPEATSKNDYLRGFHALKSAMTQGKLRKAILSRVITIDRTTDFHPLDYFRRLAEGYPQAMVYLVHHPQYGLWVGATPEVLLRKSEGRWHTVSLAGTRPHHPKGRYVWADKERDEQELVSQHIRRVLKLFSARDVEESGPRTVEAGSVAHLKTDFRFRLEDEKSTVPRLLDALHPTPAVGGLPLPAALDYIADAENRDRQLYTGYLGRVELPRAVDVYVNLRCMKIGSRRLALFSGGGITTGSEAEAEWVETREKAKTLLRHIPSGHH